MRIRFNNPTVEGNAVTYLTGKAAAGGTSLTVRDTSGFSANDFVVVGQPWQEGAEVCRITAIASATSLTVTTLSYDHPQGSPVTYIGVDKIDIEYKTSQTGDALTITGMPIDLQVDRIETGYEHSGGTSSYYYRARYYNSYADVYSEWSSWFLASGPQRDSLLWMTNRVLAILSDKESKIFSRMDVRDALNGVQDDIAAMYDNWFFLKVYDETSLKTTAGSNKVALPDDFQRLVRLDYHYDDGTNEYIYPLRPYSPIEFQQLISDQSQEDSDDLTAFTMYPGDSTNPQGYIILYPTPETSEKYLPIMYFKKMPDLSDPDDTTLVTIPNVLVYGAVSELLLGRKGQEQLATYYAQRQMRLLESLKRAQKRMRHHVEGIVPRGGHRGPAKFYGQKVVADIDTIRENYW